MKKKSMAGKMSKKFYDPLSDIMAFEDGALSGEKTKRLFQHLVDTGQAWHLQGMYGRIANDMLDAGEIQQPKGRGKGQKDAYGNPMKDYYNRK